MEPKPGFKFNVAMWVPIAGWIYLLVGVVWPFEHWALIGIWWIDLFLSVVVHGFQIIVALPAGRFHAFSTTQIVIYTFVFGATWWRPLQVAMKHTQGKD